MIKPTETIRRPTRRMLNRGRATVDRNSTRLETLIVTYVPIDSIFPNAYNPNRQSEHEFALLCKSMEEDGFTQPIIVQESTHIIVDGEHRWRAAHHLGYTEIPVVFVNMTAEQMRIATLRHNRARGSEDIELSTAVLRDLRELGALDWAVDSLDISEKDLERLLNDASAPEALARETYNSSWEPDIRPAVSLKTREQYISSTPAAYAIQAQSQMQIAQAKDKVERIAILREEKAKVIQIGAVFYHEDAHIVRSVLGDNPAVSLLAICKEELDARTQ